MNSWNSKEWKSSRNLKIMGKKCSQCGTHKDLHVHHNYLDSKLYNLTKKRIIKALIRQKMQNGEIPFLGKISRIFRCTKCSSKKKFYRDAQKTITCPECKLVFALDRQNSVITKEYNYNLGITGIKMFERKYRDEIEKQMQEKGQFQKPEYMNLNQDTAILCKKCHYAIENGYDLCSICKKRYKKIKYQKCYDCLSEEERYLIKLK